MPFLIEPSVEIASRYDLVLLANARGYLDAVEVGVDQGVFAREFLSRFNGNWLFLVDPYLKHKDFPYDRSIDAFVAAAALAPFHGKFRFVRMRSPEAVPVVQSFISPQLVYVDASHEEADVAADLEAWWEVLPPTGLLAGHDWDERHPGVMVAVERFAREKNVVVRTTGEKDFPASWMIYRQEPAELITRYFRSGSEPNPHVPPAT